MQLGQTLRSVGSALISGLAALGPSCPTLPDWYYTDHPDLHALRKDWQHVGRDMWEVLDRYHGQM